MSDTKTEPITKEKLPQVIERLAYIKGVCDRANITNIAAITVSYYYFIILVALLLIALLVLSGTGLEDSLDSLPNFKIAIASVADVLMKLPDLWYIRIPLVAVFVYGSSTVLNFLVRIILYILLPRGPRRFSLPKDPIKQAKELYKRACNLCDFFTSGSSYYVTLIPIIIIASIPVLYITIMAIREETFISQGLILHIVSVIVVVGMCVLLEVIGLAILCFLAYPILLVNSKMQNIPQEKELFSELLDLRGKLREYWVSVDPQEAAKVAEEERRQRRRSSDRSWLYAGLPQYERAKADAARSLGYSGSSGGSSSYDRKLHDELDAAEYARIVTDKFGPDWVGYDAESTTLGPDPDSYDPPGYDPEAYHGPDTSGL